MIKMIKETYTNEEKTEISKQIKNITFCDIDKEMKQLIAIGDTASSMSSRSRIGNNVVDYFTFSQRLSTRGKYNINFYEFIVNLDEFKKRSSYKTCYIIMRLLKIKLKKRPTTLFLKRYIIYV